MFTIRKMAAAGAAIALSVSGLVFSAVPAQAAPETDRAQTFNGVKLTGGGSDYPFNPVFNDVFPKMLHAGAISWMYDNRISTGWVEDGRREYRPVEPISREAMAAFVYRFAGSPEFEGNGCFADVHGLQFEKQICWMKSEGITTGYPDGTYHPFESVNRDAMAAFLHRLSNDSKFHYNGTQAELFTDVKVGMLHADHIAWMKSTGISTGWPDGTYRPLEPVNRDAMAAFLYRFAKLYPDAFVKYVEPELPVQATPESVSPEVAALVKVKCEYSRFEDMPLDVQERNPSGIFGYLFHNYLAPNGESVEHGPRVKDTLKCNGLPATKNVADSISAFYPNAEVLEILLEKVDGATGKEFNPNLPKLKIINLLSEGDGTGVTEVADFNKLPNLVSMSISIPTLEKLPNFSHLPGVQYIQLVRPDGEITLPTLEKMVGLENFRVVRSTTSGENARVNVPNLAAKNLSILRFDTDAKVSGKLSLTKLPRLVQLLANNNEITEIGEMDLPVLREMNLSANKLTKVSDIRTPQLRELNLSNNLLTNAGVPDFTHLFSLESLDLSGNNFAHNPVFTHLPPYAVVQK